MRKAVDKSGLKSLKESADKNRKLYNYDSPDKELLEWFPCPKADNTGSQITLHIEAPEFSSLCPLTGQPDFATIHIDYRPRDRCVESKSLKLYLMTFRQHGAFHEEVTQQICDDLASVLEPEWLHVRGEFTPRGGIAFWPTAQYSRKREEDVDRV